MTGRGQPDYQTATEIDLELRLQKIKRCAIGAVGTALLDVASLVGSHQAKNDQAQLEQMFVPLPVLKGDYRADFAIGLHDILTEYQTSFRRA